MPEEMGDCRHAAPTSTGIDIAQAQAYLAKIRRAPESTSSRCCSTSPSCWRRWWPSGQKTFLTSQVHIEATLETNRELEAQNQRLEQMNPS